ncbi:unnamed protein product, partial [Prorocentrum cordatum]
MFDQTHGRVLRTVPNKIIWDSLESEFRTDRDIARILASQTHPVMMVPAYNQHPVVIEARQQGRQPPIPLGFYLDGVQYISQAAGRSDTALGFWIINMLSGRRHFISALKGQDLCQCGRRGHCSRFPVMHHVRWQLRAMQRGAVPTLLRDGQSPCPEQWPPGKRLPYTAIMRYIKGDWAEHTHTLGSMPWGAAWNPCQFCWLEKNQLHDCDDALCDPDPPWPLKDRGSHERLISKDIVINDVVLNVGDRLCPSESLPD